MGVVGLAGSSLDGWCRAATASMVAMNVQAARFIIGRDTNPNSHTWRRVHGLVNGQLDP